MNTNTSALSASQLEAFLDHTESALEQQTESGLSEELRTSTLRDTLMRQEFRADTLGSVHRLFRLWQQANEPERAMAMVANDGALIVPQLPANEQAQARLSLAFWQMEAQKPGSEGMQSALQTVLGQLQALPLADQSDESWSHLSSFAHFAGDHGLVRTCATARHAYQLTLPQRAAFRAWDQAVLSMRLATSFANEALTGESHASADAAIHALVDASPDQDVDSRDWLRLGQSMVELNPERIAEVAKHVRSRVPPRSSVAIWRDIEVQIARLEAKTLHQQGQLAEALVKARQGRFRLVRDDDDEFSATVLDWLVEAGNWTQAAALAFECVFNERESAGHACRLAQTQRALHPNPHWSLTLAYASLIDATAWVCGEEDPSSYFQRHMQMAQELQPDTFAWQAVQACYLLQSPNQWAAALPLLERAVQQADLANSGLVPKLWACRIRVYGMSMALTMPFVESPSAGWNYNIGVMISGGLNGELPEETEWPGNSKDDLAARYYELGLRQFEAFFASSEGNYRDGDIHVYSMLCNNLAIYYCYYRSSYQAAIALHRKGIASSPFAEHYNGLQQSLFKLEDYANFVDAAEQLWHYSEENGYSRHKPSAYIGDVSYALYDLGRHNDIAIWLQRLDEWWNDLDEEDQSENAESCLRTVVYVLFLQCETHPADALTRLEADLPRIQALRDPIRSRYAGHVLLLGGQAERALAVCQEGLSFIDSSNESDAWMKKSLREEIVAIKAQLPRTRPWWQFWPDAH